MSIFDRDDDPPRLVAPDSVPKLYPPYREALFGHIRPVVSNELLLTIAKCDYDYDPRKT